MVNHEQAQVRAVSALSMYEFARLNRRNPSIAATVAARELRADTFDSMGLHEFASEVRQATRHAALEFIAASNSR